MAAIIFDLDDTLYPHEQYVHSGFCAVARHVDRFFGVPAATSYATLRRARELHRCGRELQALCEVHGLDEAIVPDLLQVYRTHRPQLWLSHDARVVLDQMRQHGWRLAVLTNGAPAAQALKIGALALHSLVDLVVYAEEHARGGKPSRAPFAEALCRLEVQACDAVMVGDDPVNDIEGGRAAGLRTIHLPRAGGRRSLQADATAGALTDVPALAAVLARPEVARAA